MRRRVAKMRAWPEATLPKSSYTDTLDALRLIQAHNLVTQEQTSQWHCN